MTALAACMLEVYYRHMPIYGEDALEGVQGLEDLDVLDLDAVDRPQGPQVPEGNGTPKGLDLLNGLQ